MEGVIRRDVAAAGRRSHDLLIVGGGVYGVALALEAARRGKRPLLIERGDFGGQTSFQSLRIVHGGLRYLQTLDLVRFRESVDERAWFLRHFPDLVRPLPCLMPLYGKGTRRPAVLRAALAANDFLSRHRNRGIRADRALPDGRVLDAGAVRRLFPGVDREGLRGGALWQDAVMTDSERLVIEMLRWACCCGASALNYVEARSLLVEGGRAVGLRAVDLGGEGEHALRAAVVVNCAGPWCREVAARFDRDVPGLFPPSIALNAVLDREPPAEVALAVTARRPGARTYFLHPWKGRIFAGTLHAPWSGSVDLEEPPEELVTRFVEELNEALPALALRRADLLRLRWGFLPAAREGTEALAVRPAFHDHGAHGGPAGLLSLSGVKFTTARHVAEETLRRLFGRELPAPATTPRPPARKIPGDAELDERLEHDRDGVRRAVRTLLAQESVVRIEDLLFRRTDWGVDPRRERERSAALVGLLKEIRAEAAP